jgi:GNAT superfamily N-acetyltransferase
MTRVRDAEEFDVDQIRDIFLASYGQDYAYPQFYDLNHLKKMIFSEDVVLVVAEDETRGKVVGTASVILQVGAYADLVGEFGRLAVHPTARGKGIGGALLEGRIQRVRDRLDLGIIDARVRHAYSQRIALSHGFVPVGFLPLKLRLTERESVVPMVQYFHETLHTRRNHPRIISEVATVAEPAMESVGIEFDAVIDDHSHAYPLEDDFSIEDLTTDGYWKLLRVERGRVHHREILGPMRLHYGLFQLRAHRSNYLVARRRGRLCGAVGFTVDEVERAVRIFEIIAPNDGPIRHLLTELIERASENWRAEYIEVDVSA